MEVFLIEVTEIGGVEGNPSNERRAVYREYLFDGDKKPIIEYNDYWAYGDGSLTLMSVEGTPIVTVRSMFIENAKGIGIEGETLRKLFDGLKKPGDWARKELHGKNETVVTLTWLKAAPEISVWDTWDKSDLNPEQGNKIRIYGRKLFPDGGTMYGKDPKRVTSVLLPKLEDVLSKAWESLIRAETGKNVRVKVDDHNVCSDALIVQIRIEADSESDFHFALSALGVYDPMSVDPDITYGEDDKETRFVGTVRLCERWI